jgi:pentatricopeptide repeat protein
MTGAAYKILAWAGKFGVSPDIITYNTLLRQLIKGGHTKESMALLQRMQKTGIQADEYTFTIILDETLGDMEGLSPEESIEIVQSIFEDMVSAGVMPGAHIYSKIIRQLLDGEGGGNMVAVDAVLAYMAKQNRDPGPAIYTMLMNYEFTRQPPNLDGARRIIERATATAGGTDEVFWNRAIVGYASVGETGPALRILGRVQDSMGKVGWKSMRAVLLALIDNQQMELAKKLVDNAVIDNGGPFPSTDTSGIERQTGWNFWTLAREYGLVEQGRHLKEYETQQLTEEKKEAQENLQYEAARVD